MSRTVFADLPFVVHDVSSAPTMPSRMASIGSLPITGLAEQFFARVVQEERQAKLVPSALANATVEEFSDAWLAPIKPTVAERTYESYSQILRLYVVIPCLEIPCGASYLRRPDSRLATPYFSAKKRRCSPGSCSGPCRSFAVGGGSLLPHAPPFVTLFLYHLRASCFRAGGGSSSGRLVALAVLAKGLAGPELVATAIAIRSSPNPKPRSVFW
jgi:hypothetical protein